jgi:hypothetical protein
LGRIFSARRLLGAVIVIVLIGASLVTRVDDRSYATTPAYRQTLDNLQSAAAETAVVHGPLMVGFGEAGLSPDLGGETDDWRKGRFPGLSLAGFSSRMGKSATGVHDPLWVKSIALDVAGQRVVLTSLDMLIVPTGVTELLKPVLPSLGLSRSELYLSATHTHSGPGGWGEGWVYALVAGIHRDGVEQWIAQQIETSVREALADLKPAEMGESWVDIPELTRNRTADDGPPHGGFPILAFRQTNGQSVVLGSYAAHPVIMSGGNLEYSGDYPGAWQRAMEKRGFDHAVFMAGPVGGQTAAGPRYRFSAVEAYGETLATRVEAVLPKLAYRNETELGALGLDMVLPSPQLRFADMWRVRPWVARLLLPLRPQTYFQAIRVGRTILISTPADYAGELALPLEADLRKQGLTVAVTSFNGDYVGYILPGKYDHVASYETREMAFFGPGMGDFAADILARMAGTLAVDPRPRPPNP